MEVQTISQQAFSVLITEQELNRRRLSPEAVTASEALTLIGELTGSKPPGPTRLELFPGRHELQIFVLQNAGRLRYFRFDSIEELLRAVSSEAFRDPASLFFYQGKYILAVWTGGREETALLEFGEEVPMREGFLPHLYEHGRVLLDGSAASGLAKTFL